ncbi:aldose 1-epimerase family protein [uncultured Limosilactobacillus sp.]|uniref:aldose 1-epimerase family protein n=1 Tax=uncultured Limosilactobacillus sp. TaxID=2837629 RepID=UPI0025F062C1|nr:aldose 1-epimerase family protein [uncultured Limosilactobacillus sp.]
MITIKDSKLKVQIDPIGAQLHSLQYDGLEYLWQGDPKSWKRQAPILFPFVGRLKNDQYEYQGAIYHQTQHGFARDEKFAVISHDLTQATFQLTDNERTRQAYPFTFRLAVTYQIVAGQLSVTYKVTNPSTDQILIYALGAHPGFNVPLTNNHRFEEMVVTVDPAKKYPQIKLVAPGPLNDLEHPATLDFQKPLQLHHDLFSEDALILQTAGKPATITVSDPARQHGVHVITNNNKLIGVWSPFPAKANLLCIEPWWGIADGINSDGQLTHKQLMDRLEPGKYQQYRFAIQPF